MHEAPRKLSCTSLQQWCVRNPKCLIFSVVFSSVCLHYSCIMIGLKCPSKHQRNPLPVLVGEVWTFESSRPKRAKRDPPCVIVAILQYNKGSINNEVLNFFFFCIDFFLFFFAVVCASNEGAHNRWCGRDWLCGRLLVRHGAATSSHRNGMQLFMLRVMAIIIFR